MGRSAAATTSAGQPAADRATSAVNSRRRCSTTPTRRFLYGDLVAQYLKNVATQYLIPALDVESHVLAGRRQSRQHAGRDAQAAGAVPDRLQEAARAPHPHDGVTRQWIFDKGDGTYTEYMTRWAFTNPLPNQLSLSNIPLDAPIWATINAQLATFNLQTDATALYPNTGTDADDAQFLVAGRHGEGVDHGQPDGDRGRRVIASGPVAASPAALSAALAALGAAAPANYNEARTAWLAADQPPRHENALTTTVVGAWGVAQLRKIDSHHRRGARPGDRPASPAAASPCARSSVFFGGLPGGVVSTQTVTADPVKAGTAPTISVTIDERPTAAPRRATSRSSSSRAARRSRRARARSRATRPRSRCRRSRAGTYDYTRLLRGRRPDRRASPRAAR